MNEWDDHSARDDGREMLWKWLSSSNADPDCAEELISLAERLMASGSIGIGLDAARFAVDLAPENWRVLRGASGLIAITGDYRTCAALMVRAVQIAPNNSELRLHYAAVLIELEEYQDASEQLDSHLRISPASGLGWRNRSTVAAFQGDYEEALAFCDRALALEPSNREYSLHRAGLLVALRRNGEAIRSLQELAKDKADDPDVARLLSAAFESVGDIDSALRQARRAAELAPNSTEIIEHRDHLQNAHAKSSVDGRLFRSITETNKRTHFTHTKVGALQIQFRVIFSILIREARTRFGHSRLGYAWAVFEPVSHLLLLAIVFSYVNKGYAPVGSSLLVYYFSGVLLYILFTNTISNVQNAVEANRSLLQIPIIKQTDVLMARAILELLTEITVAAIMLAAFSAYGLDATPHDILTCASAVLSVWFLATGIGALNGVMSHFFRSWEHVFGAVVRSMYFTSGIFLSPIEMPDWVRRFLEWNPLLQGIEWFRSGFYSSYDPNWLNPDYLIGCAMISLAAGFGIERALRRQLSVSP